MQRTVSKLEPLASEIIIVKAPGAKLPPVSTAVTLDVVQDPVGGKGPLAGICTGLSRSGSCYNLVVACDMPFLNRDLLAYLVSSAEGYDAVVPRYDHYLEPLHAVYSKKCIVEIAKLIEQGRLGVDGLFNHVRTLFVESAQIACFDPEHLSFMNINTPLDLKTAEELIGGS